VTFSPSAGATPTGYALTGLPAGAVPSPATRGQAGPYQFRVTGLDCAQAYALTVAARYPSGDKTASGAAVHPCLAPGAPQNPSLDVGTQRQVTATWSAPADDGGGAVTYSVSLDGGAAVGVGTATTHTFGNLANFQTYNVSVTATNGAGSSAPPAQASGTLRAGPWPGHIGNNCCLAVNLRNGPHLSSTVLQTFPPPGGQPVRVVCVTTGDAWKDPSGSPAGNTWYQVDQPQAGYVATGYVPDVSGVWSC
jgi:hypothetical protein